MIVIRGSFKWKSGQPPLAAMGAIGQRVRDLHKGNIDYRVSVDSGDPAQLFLNEAWESAADFAAHGESDEVREFGTLLHGKVSDVVLNMHGVASTTAIPVDLGQG